MKIKKINTGILITKTSKQPSAKIEFSLDELDSLSEFCERLQDEKDIREYLTTAVKIPDSAEVSAPIAAKYLHDAALFEQLVDETRRNQEENQSNFLTAVSDAVSSIEKSRDVKEWHVFDGEFDKSESEMKQLYTECLNLAKSIDAIMLCYNPDIDALKAENLSDMAVRLLDGVSRRDVVKDLEDFRDKWRHYNEQAAAESQVILDKISELFEKDGDSK